MGIASMIANRSVFFSTLVCRSFICPSKPIKRISKVSSAFSFFATSFEIVPEGFKLLERAPGVTVEDIQQATEGTLLVEGEVPEMQL